MRTIDHFIGGRRVSGGSTATAPVYDPAKGEVQAEVPLASGPVLDEAVTAAKDAYPAWRRTPLGRRSEILFEFRRLLHEHRDELARLVSSEHGKVVADAMGEVARGLENVDYACGIPDLLQGRYAEQVSSGVDVHSVRQPLGVVAGITPFNFPVMVPLWMISNALACGNSFVLKPSERDPSASVLLSELFLQAGLPPGVLNVVHGDKEAVSHLLDHTDIEAVSFVGSTPVARSVHRRATETGKRVQALGGAKNHMVVLPDADLDVAADASVSAAYGSAGERCMAVSVLVAVGDVADELVDAVADRIDDLRVGPGSDPGSEMGPLVTGEHRDRVAGYLDIAADEGAVLTVDGRKQSFDSDGFFLGASLVDRVEPSMQVYRDEIFGPVLSVVRVDTLEDAIEVVNANEYGNGCALFTRDGGAARRFEYEIDCGMVGINVPIPVPVASFSFGGWKRSLFGDSHMYGPEGIQFYTRGKVVTSRWPEPAGSRIDLSFPASQRVEEGQE